MEKTIVLYSEQGLSSRKVDLKRDGNKNNVLLFITLVTFFKGERNAIKCTSSFPAAPAPLAVLCPCSSEPWGAFPAAAWAGPCPARGASSECGAGDGSPPREHAGAAAAAFGTAGFGRAAFSYKSFKLLRLGFL